MTTKRRRRRSREAACLYERKLEWAVRILLRVAANWVSIIFHFCCLVVDLQGFYSESPLVKLLYWPSRDKLIYVGQSPSPFSLSSFFTQPPLRGKIAAQSQCLTTVELGHLKIFFKTIMLICHCRSFNLCYA